MRMRNTEFPGEGGYGVMVKAQDFGIIVHEFKLQSHYYVHFLRNTFGNGMNPFITPSMS